MTYAEELMLEVAREVCAEGLQEGRAAGLQQGRREGLEGQVGTIEDLLPTGVRWPDIEAATGIDQDDLRALKQQLAGSEEATKEAD